MPRNSDDKIGGWNSYDPIFAELIGNLSPRLICEVGSWLGASAINMAQLAPEATVYCVDTWKGSREHAGMHFLPTLYESFLSNVRDNGLQSRVLPLRMTSAEGYHKLKGDGLVFDLIYIDGSHEYDDVKQDLAMYWELLRTGGIMLGDDFNEWGTVQRAVNEFGKPTITRNHWHFVK